jgi:hypothetical protein
MPQARVEALGEPRTYEKRHQRPGRHGVIELSYATFPLPGELAIPTVSLPPPRRLIASSNAHNPFGQPRQQGYTVITRNPSCW